MIIGYARVSTYDQNLDLQISALKNFGCKRIYKEKKSAVASRTELENVLANLKRGDTLVVWKLDRLGRSLHELVHFIEMFGKQGINFASLQDNIDTSTAIGKLFFQITAAFAEYERSLIVERTRAGLEAARERGVKLGRKKGLSKKALFNAEKAVELYIQDDMSVREIAKSLNISIATFYKYLHILGCPTTRPAGKRNRNKAEY